MTTPQEFSNIVNHFFINTDEIVNVILNRLYLVQENHITENEDFLHNSCFLRINLPTVSITRFTSDRATH